MKSTTAKIFHYDQQDLEGLFASRGLQGEALGEQTKLLKRCLEALRREAGDTATESLHAFFVPGRIEVLGKHTDYAGGRSLVCAVDRGFCFLARRNKDRRIHVTDVLTGQCAGFDLDHLPQCADSLWENYPLTVVKRLTMNFGETLGGADLFFGSNLPAASGMSSSSALMIGVFLCLSAISSLPGHQAYRANIDSSQSLAGYLACVENGQSYGTLAGLKGVGTFGGSEDHIAILCGRHDSLIQYRYSPVVHERTIAVPPDYGFAVAYSGVKANKTEEPTLVQYNNLSLMTRRIADLWQRTTGGAEPHLWAILQSGPSAAEQLKRIIQTASENGFSPQLLNQRLKHFEVENEEIVPEAGNALARGDIQSFRSLVAKSQRAAETLLGNQTLETSCLAQSALECGAAASSAFGAGFGGSVWALARRSNMGAFIANWRDTYERQFAKRRESAAFISCNAGPPACCLLRPRRR